MYILLKKSYEMCKQKSSKKEINVEKKIEIKKEENLC